eukprot:TRINITY_DN26940_c0_g1_i1.p1 TRINITY_DN26940_c0_g1~~TRINITY_DN26940_c0_g1_i1.p1  ORF type:complete len:543 (+),score=69.27 TRINITY_DN26940_c0_g1_i1:118-1629(+)
MMAMSVMGVSRDAFDKLCKFLFGWLVRRLWVTVRLEEKDAELVLAWLRERPEIHKSTQLTLYSRGGGHGHSKTYEYEPELQVTTRLRVGIKGGPSQWIWITRRESAESSDRRMPGATVSFFGSNKKLLESILESGREIQRRRMEKHLTVVQVYDFGREHGLNWLHPQDKDRKQPGRSISSVVLPRCPLTGLDQAEALLEDAREFLASELWYTERGIPYRRGYLLHGVPGGGKSALVQAIASELMCPMYMLQLSSGMMTDETLSSLLQYGMHDPPTLLVLEDVDLLHSAVLRRRSSADEKEPTETVEDSEDKSAEEGRSEQSRNRPDRKRSGRLTLAGLLNALDGPIATRGRLLFMTTNDKSRLDPALLRSGRIDYEIEFKAAEQEQIERLFVRFYQDFRSGVNGLSTNAAAAVSPTSDIEAGVGSRSDSAVQPGVKNLAPKRTTQELATAFAKQAANSGVKLTSADIQRHLMKRKRSPERALRELPSLIELRANHGDPKDVSQ